MASHAPRKRKGPPFGAASAFLFNLTLVTAVFVAAGATSRAFSGPSSVFETNAETIAATSRAINARFARLGRDAGGEDSREAWASIVASELEAGDFANARGLLLAAPAMLTGADGQSLRARLEVTEAGAEPAIAAALTYLPAEAQDAYRRLETPIAARIAPQPAEAEDREAPSATPVAAVGAGGSGWLNAGRVTPSAETPVDAAPAFSVLGDPRDLAMTAARWRRGDPVDEFAFFLSGVGRTLSDVAAQEGASLVLSAHRANRLNPRYALSLSRRLFQTASTEDVAAALLRREESGELQTEFGYVAGGPVVEAAFREVARGAGPLAADLRLISSISGDTTPAAAVSILGVVESSSDLRRARLVTEAGGERAVALARLDPEGFLDAAQRVVNWSNPLRLQIAGLAACGALLILLSFNLLVRSLARHRPVQRSAVYRISETLVG